MPSFPPTCPPSESDRFFGKNLACPFQIQTISSEGNGFSLVTTTANDGGDGVDNKRQQDTSVLGVAGGCKDDTLIEPGSLWGFPYLSQKIILACSPIKYDKEKSGDPPLG